uniref:Peptidase S8/S53 domain-containing protein n=1 Tax=Amphimedon queenslandica TaxID=400682 RepID=A0A1X7TJ79_AMPQE
MDDIKDIPRDDILDFSYLPKEHRFVDKPQPVYGDRFKGADGILIATLGYGLNEYPFLNSDHGRYRPIKVIEQHLAVLSPEDKSQKSEKTYDHWITSPWIINSYTKTSDFIVCQTTDPDGFIVNGATAKALKQLKLIWDKRKGSYDNLVVLIPYGGQYMEDEMQEIYEATNEGIIIVCAAGREGGDVVFPAALGSVISVGVAGTGPKGREIDVSIDFETRPARLVNYDKKEVELPRDCGIAAARVAGLISLLLSRINSIMKEPGKYTDNPIKNMAMHIRDSKPNFLHTYVIRELIVNEGNGSHDPQLGYGDGEQIILSLLEMDPSFLIQKLANIVCGQMNTEKVDETDGDKIKETSEKFHDLKGKNIHVGIIDDFKVAPPSDSIEKFKWQPHPKDLHGDKCAMVLRNVSSECQIWCLNIRTPGVDSIVKFFEDCISEEYKTIDVISCSMGIPCFHLGLCTAVDKAVQAGKIIVFAAGNCGLSQQNSIFYPGRNGNIIVVGRGDGFYNRARYSSAGREMDFLAQVQCVKPNKASSGTSFAAPVVAGYIALLLEFIQKEMEYDRIEVWSGKKWENIPISKAARNVYAMRALLKLLVVKPQVHSETEGFGCLNFSALFPEYASDGLEQSDAKAFSTELAKKKIRQALKKFYKRDINLVAV